MVYQDTVLVTGAAGFIGAALSLALLARGQRVVGIDNLNDYYPVSLKHAHIGRNGGDAERFRFIEIDFSDKTALNASLAGVEFSSIVHLGTQAGVRYSLQNPQAYVASNLVGHVNILELARTRDVAHRLCCANRLQGSSRSVRALGYATRCV